MPSTVEELSASLVREFLSRKGLKDTLTAMDNEMPRNEASISNRAVLAHELCIERLIRKNKESTHSYCSMVEVIVNYLIKKLSSSSGVQQHRSSSVMTSQPQMASVDNDGKPITYTATPQSERRAEPEGRREARELEGRREARELEGRREASELAGTTTATIGGRREPVASLVAGGGSSVGRTTKISSSRVKLNRASHRPSPGGAEVKKTSRLHQRITAPRTGPHHELTTPPASTSTGPHHELTTPPASTSTGPHHELTTPPASTSTGPHHELTTPPASTSSNMAVVETSKRTLQADQVMGSAMPHHERIGKDHGLKTDHGRTRAGRPQSNQLVFEDIEDDELNLDYTTGSLGRGMAAVCPRGKPITMDAAKSLRQLLFGSSVGPSFNAEWRQQNFIFSDRPQLQYGLVQHKGGPCGVLACVQAYVLKHLLFSADSRSYPTISSPEPSKDERRVALVSALCEILWRAASDSEQAVLTLWLSTSDHSSKGRTAQYTPDGLTEQLMVYTCNDRSTLNQFISSNIRAYESPGGCIMMLYSAVLSRGITRVQSDMDEITGHLMGAHGYCTQELVNLLVTGRAVSNVFNGTVQLDSGGDTKHTLCGIHHQSEVGFLSLFEHYGSCTVGSYYKDPVHPIWVVCSESHFTVLFGLRPSDLHNQDTQLVYYDGLGNFDEPVILTITPRDDDGGRRSSLSDGNQLIPPLNLCLLTRWTNITISWNTEPIL